MLCCFCSFDCSFPSPLLLIKLTLILFFWGWNTRHMAQQHQNSDRKGYWSPPRWRGLLIGYKVYLLVQRSHLLSTIFHGWALTVQISTPPACSHPLVEALGNNCALPEENSCQTLLTIVVHSHYFLPVDPGRAPLLSSGSDLKGFGKPADIQYNVSTTFEPLHDGLTWKNGKGKPKRRRFGLLLPEAREQCCTSAGVNLNSLWHLLP